MYFITLFKLSFDKNFQSKVCLSENGVTNGREVLICCYFYQAWHLGLRYGCKQDIILLLCLLLMPKMTVSPDKVAITSFILLIVCKQDLFIYLNFCIA